MGSRRVWVATVCVAVPLLFLLWLLVPARRQGPPSFADPRPAPKWHVDPAKARDYRDRALKKARTWHATDPRSADFSRNPSDPSGLLSTDVVECRHLEKAAGGTSPKFDCVLADGEVVRVKYNTQEINAEIAASRLLTALGFGADRVYSIQRLRCHGCPREPFYTTKTLDYFHLRNVASNALPAEGFTDFEWVAVERHFDGVTIEAEDDQGWAWFELRDADAAVPGPRPERDALRLAALLLAHWDNKASNQRLMCKAPVADGSCAEPIAIIQDLGSTFGPDRVALDAWAKAPIWADRARCTVSMKTFPYDGGTFPDGPISERGRKLLARQLAALTDLQLTTLFAAARFPEADGHEDADVGAWTKVLRAKIDEIAGAGPCAD